LSSGKRWGDIVLYELHIGAFTAAGTFKSCIEKLDHLAELGVSAIAIMPIADFPGRRNWGYDGVFPYAPDSSYGRPDDFKALVEAAHARDIAVVLDVVYNQLSTTRRCGSWTKKCGASSTRSAGTPPASPARTL
jgi:1,4-alpha-glucan branching enzyme/maltooligosyltrehalose trehalohydrolase